MRLVHPVARRSRDLIALLFALAIFAFSCSDKTNSASIRDADGQVKLTDAAVDPSGKSHTLTGKASYYAERFNGRKTASGELFDSEKMTAAHRTLPFGTVVRVLDPQTNRSVVVTINDRGPYAKRKIIDLSRAAAEDLDMIKRGTLPVQLVILQWGE